MHSAQHYFYINPETPWWNVRVPSGNESFYFHVKGSLEVLAAAGGPPVLSELLGRAQDFEYNKGWDGDRLVAEFEASPIKRHLRLLEVDKKWQAYSCKEGYVCVGGEGAPSCAIVITDKAWFEELSYFFTTRLAKTQARGQVYIAVSTPRGLDFKPIGVGGEPLERGNYPSSVLGGYDQIVRDLNSSAPAGRVSILSGPPGSGKSFIVRGLLDAAEASVCAVLPAELVSQLTGPSFMPALLDLSVRFDPRKSIVLFIEDADAVLAPRMGDNMGSVSALLNLGDGIVGQLLDVRIVCTTNQKHTEIDEALLRPGRLSASVQVGALAYDEAALVYRRLCSKPLPVANTYTLAEVYQLARADGWTPAPKAAKMGFSK